MANKEDDDVKSRSGLMTIIKAVAILSVLVIVQVVAASFMIPTPQATEKLARDLAAAKAGEELTDDFHEGGDVEETSEANEELVEVKIGDFSVTRYNLESDKVVNIDFEVYAAVLAAEADEYTATYQTNENRIREQVSLTIHSAEPSDLSDRGLGLIKRLILERTNRALGKPLVKEVFLTRFNFVQR